MSNVPFDFGVDAVKIPDVPEPLIGYRWWFRHGGDGFPLLCSPRTGLPWPPGTPHKGACLIGSHNGGMEAACTVCPCPPKTPNHDGYGCGLYAYRTVHDLVDDIEFPFRKVGIFEERMDVVVGQVALWGEVWDHAKGYRAQYGRVTKLYVYPAPGGSDESDFERVEAELAEVMPCEVRLVAMLDLSVDRPELEDLAEQYDVPLEEFPMTATEVDQRRWEMASMIVVDAQEHVLATLRAMKRPAWAIALWAATLLLDLVLVGVNLAQEEWFMAAVMAALSAVFMRLLFGEFQRRRLVAFMEKEMIQDG